MEWFRNLNARPRVMLSVGFILALFCCISYLAISELSKSHDQVESLYRQDLLGTIQIDNIIAERFSMAKSNRQAILDMKDTAKFAADEKATAASIADIHSSLDSADKSFYTTEGKELLEKIRNGLPGYEQANKALMDRAKAKDFAGAKAALDQVAAQGKPISEAADTARKQKQELAKAKFESNVRDYESSRAIILGTAMSSLVLGVILSLILARGFSIPLGLAVYTLERLAAGDLTASMDVHTRDEVGRMAVALNAALAKLRSTLQTVSDSATAANGSAAELTSVAEAISTGSQEQAASLQETSASLEQITAAVRQSADNAKQANQLVTSCGDSARRGQEIVVTAVSAMEDINVASAKISDIISTVNDIAFQTNLLAVNAAVEAARAGEQGRGFAVVAAEVRSLAVRSADSAKEIKGLIQDTLKKVERGTELVNLSGETLKTIVTSVKRVTDIVGEISSAAQEQSTGIDQVSNAVTQIDRVTQTNSAQTEELSSTTQTVSEQSLRLTELIAFFKLGDDTEEAPSSFAAPTRAIRSTAKPMSSRAPLHRAAPRPALVLAGDSSGSDFEEF